MSGASSFNDHFSSVAGDYSTFRPSYPDALFEALAGLAPNRTLAWDCAAGTGQASLPLADRFKTVLATDGSARQLRQASLHERVLYAAARAEACPLPDASVSLVTVAQALHWFDVHAFYRECERVIAPGGVIAVWTYGQLHVDDNAEVARLVDDFSERTVGAWWPAERRHVDNGYATLPFPFPRIELPPFEITARWRLAQLIGYLRTWSSVSARNRSLRVDSVAEFEPSLRLAWGDGDTLLLRWPLTVIAGRRL